VQVCTTGASGVALVISLVLLEETFVEGMATRRRIFDYDGRRDSRHSCYMQLSVCGGTRGWWFFLDSFVFFCLPTHPVLLGSLCVTHRWCGGVGNGFL
jgi:hypothetical protein